MDSSLFDVVAIVFSRALLINLTASLIKAEPKKTITLNLEGNRLF